MRHKRSAVRRLRQVKLNCNYNKKTLGINARISIVNVKTILEDCENSHLKLNWDEAQLDASRRRKLFNHTTVILFFTNIYQLLLGSNSNSIKDALRDENFPKYDELVIENCKVTFFDEIYIYEVVKCEDNETFCFLTQRES